MADVTLYLNPDGSGTDAGTISNPFLSWDSCVTYLNANHADMVTATESVDVIVSGGIEDHINVGLDIAVICSETYPLRFDASAVATPGIWDTAKPTLSWSPTSDLRSGFIDFTTSGSVDLWVEFINMNIIWNQAYTGGTTTRFFLNSGTKASLTSKIVFNGCYVKGGNNTGSGTKTFYYSQAGGMTLDADNTIFEDFTTSSGALYPIYDSRFASEGVVTIVNSTLINIDTWSFTGTARNNQIMINCLLSDVTDPAIDEHANCGYNASDAATTLPGSNNTNSASFSFVSSTDRHLSSANTWGAGTGVATFGAYVPALDIDGDSRGTTVSAAGADEASGSSLSVSVFTNANQLI